MIGGIRKAGSKDPRAMVNRARPYSPDPQADQVQNYLRTLDPGRELTLPEAQELAALKISNRNRVLCDYAVFSYYEDTFVTTEVFRHLLIPRNLNRSNFYVINLAATAISVSFDNSLFMGGLGYPLGFFLEQGQWFSDDNAVIGVNDIYVNVSIGTIPISFMGFEGTPAIGSRQ